MRHIGYLGILTALGAFASVSNAAPPTYTVIEIAPAGVPDSDISVRELNDEGVIVGSQQFPDEETERAFRYRRGVFKIIGAQTPGSVGVALAVNSSPHIVGYHSPNNSSLDPVVWSGRQVIVLPHPPESSGVALRITDNDWIVGNNFASAPPPDDVVPSVWKPRAAKDTWELINIRAAIYKAAGLGAHPELDLAYPVTEDVSSKGLVVGSFSYQLKGKARTRYMAYLWNAATGQARKIPGAMQALRINESGQVLIVLANEFYPPGTTQQRRRMLWKNNSLTPIASEIDYAGIGMTDLNDAAQVVGYFSDGLGDHAALFQDGVTYALSDLIDPSDPLYGLKLQFAVAINNAGQIVATIINPETHQRRSYLLTPAQGAAAQSG